MNKFIEVLILILLFCEIKETKSARNEDDESEFELEMEVTGVGEEYRLVKPAQKAIITYQEGKDCKNGEDKENCEVWAYGTVEVPIIRGDHAVYEFNTTDHKGMDTPILVSGKLNGLWIEAFDRKNFQASGIFFIHTPRYDTEQIWARERKTSRMDVWRQEHKKLLDYKWVECIIIGGEQKWILDTKKIDKQKGKPNTEL